MKQLSLELFKSVVFFLGHPVVALVSLDCVQYSTIVKGSLHVSFLISHLLDFYLIEFSSFPAFSLIFHNFDIKNCMMKSVFIYFWIWGLRSWVLGSWGPGNRVSQKNVLTGMLDQHSPSLPD